MEDYIDYDGVLQNRDQVTEKFGEVKNRLPEEFNPEEVEYESLEEVRQATAGLRKEKFIFYLIILTIKKFLVVLQKIV